MNITEGMRRIGIVIGALGCITGGVFGYWNLQKVWHSQTEFERLQSEPMIAEIARAVKDYKDGKTLPPTPVKNGQPEKTPEAQGQAIPVKAWEDIPDFIPDEGRPKASRWKPPESDILPQNPDETYLDILSQLSGGVRGAGFVEARRSNWFDRNATDDRQMEFTVVSQELFDAEGKPLTQFNFDIVNLDKTGTVSSIHLNTGQWLHKQPKLPFIGGLLFSFCLPLIGFLIPWGTIRVFVWVACGFSLPRST